MKRDISEKELEKFRKFLTEGEKSERTVEKYIRDIKTFQRYIGKRNLKKDRIIEYKHHLSDCGYKVTSINSMLSALNSFFEYFEWYDMRIKQYKVQKEIFRPEEKELTRFEYRRLCETAEKRGNERLSLVMQTICSTGIRVSELPNITAEAVKIGEAVVFAKAKTRTVFLVGDLRKKLKKYTEKRGIESGPVFITRKGTPLDRTDIWRDMKKLCDDSAVGHSKVYPHNLRHLFARVFYDSEKDISKLADILGHSNINTTRIYTISTGKNLPFRRTSAQAELFGTHTRKSHKTLL